jgi:hypothetical protein
MWLGCRTKYLISEGQWLNSGQLVMVPKGQIAALLGETDGVTRVILQPTQNVEYLPSLFVRGNADQVARLLSADDESSIANHPELVAERLMPWLQHDDGCDQRAGGACSCGLAAELKSLERP